MNLLAKIHRSPARRRVLHWLRAKYLTVTSHGLVLGKDVKIGHGVVFETWRSLPDSARIAVGDECRLEDGVRLETWGGTIDLGRNIFLGPFSVIYGHGGVEIGDGTLISMHCRILSSNHTLPPLGSEIRSVPDLPLPTRIGRDVWLGAGVTVLGGAVIGDGCVVGAGSVVTKDLPAGSIAYGVPASVARWREGAEWTQQ